MLEICEIDEASRPIRTYLSSSKKDKFSNRVDVVPAPNSLPIAQRILSVFLPSGYPQCVTPDYTPYQVFDSLQAFASSIAGLLASRAVLQGIGVGDENASATAAMLLSVLQESMGRMATILFAHWCSRSMEAECKMYRLAADIFNDTAMILDCFSPMLPKPFRVPFFCASSIFRTMCGVAGGSSKAILSSHFARADNIGELNAKDSSQETVISLLGMWAGGFVVSNVTSTFATWAWLLTLLAVHLSTNYVAVRSVTMRTLNRQRANITFSGFLSNEKKTLTPEQTALQEYIFEKDGVLRWQGIQILGTCRIGITLAELLQCTGAETVKQTGSFNRLSLPLASLMELFASEDYVLWFNPATKRAEIVLKEGATAQTQLKAWSHALRIAWVCSQLSGQKYHQSGQVIALIKDTQQTHNQDFDLYLRRMENAGWNTMTAALETMPGKRILVHDVSLSEQP